jgi:hypothetical protein
MEPKSAIGIEAIRLALPDLKPRLNAGFFRHRDHDVDAVGVHYEAYLASVRLDLSLNGTSVGRGLRHGCHETSRVPRLGPGGLPSSRLRAPPAPTDPASFTPR